MIATIFFPFPDGSLVNGWKFCQPRPWGHATEIWHQAGVMSVSGRSDPCGFFVEVTHDEDFGYWGDSAVGEFTHTHRTQTLSENML